MGAVLDIRYSRKAQLEYQREVKTQNLKTAVRRWRRLSNHIEDTLHFVKDDQALQREKSSLVNAMRDIFEITDSLTSLFPDEVFPGRRRCGKKPLRTST